MMRHTLLALALLAAPAVVMAQQPSSPMQGQAPAADTSKAKASKSTHKSSTHKSSSSHKNKSTKPAAKPAAKDTSKAKP